MPKVKLKAQQIADRFKHKVLRGETVTLVGNRIYCLGGKDASNFGAVFYVDSCIWIPLGIPARSQPRVYHATALAEDKIYLHGGEHLSTFYDDMIEVDTVLRTFRKMKSPNGRRKRSGASAVYAPWRKEIVFFGGMEFGTQSPRKNDIFTFNIDTFEWGDPNIKGELPATRSTHAAGLDKFHMYVFGGWGERQRYLNDIWIADLSIKSTVTWSMVKINGAAPTGTFAPCFHKLGDVFVHFGGLGSRHNRWPVYVYFPKRKVWAKAPGDEVELEGNLTETFLGLETPDGIVCFRPNGVYKITVES